MKSETYAEYYPFYTQTPCEPEDCCKEEEGTCCPPDKPKCPKDTIGNPISIYTGENREVETDLEFSTSHKKGFKFYRTYKSRSDIDGTMGFGWIHNYDVAIEAYDYGDVALYAFQITDESGRKHYYRSRDEFGQFSGFLSTRGYLLVETDGTYTWHRANGITYTFDSDMKLAAKADDMGNTQNLTYTPAGLLESVTDEATGRSIGFSYDAAGRIEYITGPVTAAVPDGIWVTYQYDAQGNLTHIVYADDGNGSTSSGFEYKYEDPNDIHNLTEKRNLAGEFLSRWTYDIYDQAYENITRDGKGVTISGFGTSSILVTDAQGNEKTYVFDVINGRNTITNIIGGGCSSCVGDAVRYEYDAYRRVIEIEYVNGRIDQYADFDDLNRYTTEIQAAGTPDERNFHYTHHPDTGERLSIVELSILNGGDRETIFDYDDDGDAEPNENPTNLLHRRIERGFTYDSVGVLMPYEHVTIYTYNTRGQVETIDGPLPGSQDLVSYTYDPVTGDRLSETRPLVGTTTYTYDAAGNVETVIDPNGVVTTLTYDGRSRQLGTTRNSVSESRTYSAAGELDTVTDALGRVMDYTYNTEGFIEKIIDPSGNFIYYGYDSIGQRTEESIFDSASTQTHYRGTDWGDPANNPDLAAGKPWKSLHRNHDDTADLETVYTYDSAGNLISVTDAEGNTTTYAFDTFDRLTHVTQPGSVITTYEYDPGGNLASITDAEGHVTTYTYDDLNRLVETDSPDTGNTLYSYDEAGNLRFKTQNGQTVEYQYDILGRLTDIIYADPTQNVTMTYDSGSGSNLVGRLALVTDPSGTLEYSYDANGNVESESRTIDGVVYVTGYVYDDAGNLRGITYPTGQTVTYTPDAADPALIGGVVLNGTQTLASGLAYRPFGPVQAMTLGNGISVSKSFDKNYQLLTLSADTVMDRTYLPDGVGNIELITDNLDSGHSQSFDYDDLNRLTNANGIYGTVNYTYDNVGNRLSRTKTNGTAEEDTFTYYPGTNCLQAVSGTHAELIQYDADGNTISRIPGMNNPTPPVTDPPDFIYNSSGQRAKKAATQTTIFHYDLAGQLIAETDVTGNMIRAYVWFLGQPLAMITADSSVYYFHNDHLGTPQKMTDQTGSIVWAADYLPFGQAEVTIGTVENNLRFAGQYYDQETGLHYNWNRYYDPMIGRYLRADPIGLNGGINLYSYVDNNPVDRIDPWGLHRNLGGGFGVTVAVVSVSFTVTTDTCCDDNNYKRLRTLGITTIGFELGLGLKGSGGSNASLSDEKIPKKCPKNYDDTGYYSDDSGVWGALILGRSYSKNSGTGWKLGFGGGWAIYSGNRVEILNDIVVGKCCPN